MNNNVYYNICIVGAGGTGGNLAARLAQFISTGHFKAEMILVDGDTIEESNISRQPFSRDELLQNKAVALASAIEENYEYTVKAYPHYIDTIDDMKTVFKLFSSCHGYYDTVINVLVGCCDNHRCRQVMEKYFDANNKNVIYIDSANEFSCGEVVIGVKVNGQVISPSRKFYFPAIMKSRGKRKSEESCGAVNSHAPQHLATNCFAANVILTVISKLITSGIIDGGIILIDTFNYSCVYRKYEEEVIHGAS